VSSPTADEKLLRSYLEILERLKLSDVDAAALTGLAYHTVRVVRVSGSLPRRRHCVEALEAFVAANAGAQSRAELRFTTRPPFGPSASAGRVLEAPGALPKGAA
jgi:hypothetical protein